VTDPPNYRFTNWISFSLTHIRYLQNNKIIICYTDLSFSSNTWFNGFDNWKFCE